MTFFKKIFIAIILFIIFLFSIITVTPLFFSYKNRIYNDINNIPQIDIICLLGAKVYPKGVLSPIIKQRCDTVIKLIENKKGNFVYVSGSWKYEVNHIVEYLINNNINDKFIIKDYLGYDTHDTIKHIKKSGYKKILFVSQSFHLYRAIDMSISDKLEPYGIAAEKIIPIDENISILEKYFIKLQRYYKNSILFLLFKINLYDFFSKEAESKESLK